MDLGLSTLVTLVAAPAGYGKSMLVSHWAESLAGPCAWVSLDEGDSDLGLFLRYVVAAVQKTVPESCEETDELLHGSQLPPVPVLVRTLANELDALDAPFLLVLDDYDRISMDSGVHGFLDALLLHPPEPLRLVLTTRRDPPLSLMALRAARRLTEVRLQDLQFNGPETAELLATSGKVGVGEGALGNLREQVEGWAVGLRLVALALRHVDSPDVFLSELRGGLPHTQEYLLREVLAAQPSEVRDRMLKASIPDRFCPELLDAVCGPGNPSGPGGRELVDRLERHSLFTISLDARGEWYRYHHLFRDLLRGLLRESAGAEEIAALHSRASEWFESRGLIGESIGYALAAGDVVRAAELVERHRHAELDADRWYVVDSWLTRLPAEIKEQRPGLLLARAWTNFFQLRLDRMASLLEQVEPLLDEEKTEPGLSGEVHYFRGYLSYWEGEEDGRDHFERALERLPEGQQLIPGEAALHHGLARCMTGQKEKAVQELSDRIRSTDPTRAVLLSRLIGGLILIDLLSGDLPRARVDARQLQDVARRNGLRNTGGWAWYLGACPRLHTHDLASAADHFAQAAEQKYVLESRAVIDSLAGLALTRQLLGQPDDAERAAGRLEEFARELDDPEGQSVARSCRARLALLRGEQDAAARWTRSFDEVPGSASLFLWVEVPVLTRARVLVAVGTEGSLEEATGLLGAIRRQSEACRYTGQTIEAAVLQSLALEKQGRTDAAMEALDEAVGLAGPGGWIRPFVEAGPVMAGMLERLAPADGDKDLVGRVQAAFEGGVAAVRADGPLAASATPAPVAPLPAPEGLTNRELDILELLARRLQDKEIAERLVIAPPTVNYHLKRLYRKLGVHGRRQAVDHARRAGLLLKGRSSS